MSTILIHSPPFSSNSLFDPDGRDGCHDPAIYLRERLLQCGYDLKTSDNNTLKDCEWVFFYETVSVRTYAGWYGLAKKLKAKINRRPLIRNLYEECIRAGMQKRMALFLWEPPTVCRKNLDPELHKLFPVIFTWNDAFVDNRKIFKVCVPQMRQFPKVPQIPFSQRKLLVNISMNKHSCHPRELYSARRAAIRYFERTHPDSFDLYGVGWNLPANLREKALPFTRKIYSSYRGIIKNKWDVMPYYRFSICYENIRDEPGYVTEKIFDSMRCGCVPIYWGAPNIHDYVNADAFIDRRQFKTNAELDSYLSNMTQDEYEHFQDAIRSYLAGPRFAKFSPAAYADTIINTLKLTT